MKTKILLLLILFASCDRAFEGKAFIENELLPYYQSFLDEAVIRSVSLPERSIMIYLEDDTGTARALCWSDDKYVKIAVNRSYFTYQQDWQIEATVYHELGHGLLDRGHEGANVFSLMSVPAIRADYVEKRKEYIDELFLKQER